MRVQCMTVGLVFMAGCGNWFGKSQCTEGEQRCEGNTISTCAPKAAASTAGGTQSVYEWKKTSSCSVQNAGLVCHAEDGFAACVDAQTLDAGVPTSRGDAQTQALPSGSIFSDPAPSPPAAWTRVEIAAHDAGALRIESATDALLSYTPPTSPGGQVAVVSYGADDQPLSAALVNLGAQGGSSAWVRSEGAVRIGVLAPDGRVLDSRARSNAAPKAKGLGEIVSGLSDELPPTLDVVPPGKTLLPISLVGDGTIFVSVPATPELVSLVSDALQRLPPFASGLLTQVAFVDSDLLEALGLLVAEAADGGASHITLASADDDAGVTGGALQGDASIPSSRFPQIPEATHAAVNLKAVLYVAASPAALQYYRRYPNALAVEIVREVASLLVRFTSRSVNELIPGLPWAFPADYPAHIAALLKERLSPLLLLGETFADVWGGLHSLGVQGNLASPYLDGDFALSDQDVLKGGFASAKGARSAADDFVEYAAYANVPELWTASPCPALGRATLETLDPKLCLHLAKLEALWGLGLLSGARLQNCVGALASQSNPSGIVVHPSAGENSSFAENVLGRKDPFYHGQTQVSLTADQGETGHEVTASFVVSATGATTGLFRLTSVSHRQDPQVGAGFYLSRPSTYERAEAAAGLMLVTRADTQQVAGHALMVLQGSKPIVGTAVLPLITARYDIPEDAQ